MTAWVLEQTFQYIILYTVIVVPIFSLPFLQMDYNNYKIWRNIIMFP